MFAVKLKRKIIGRMIFTSTKYDGAIVEDMTGVAQYCHKRSDGVIEWWKQCDRQAASNKVTDTHSPHNKTDNEDRDDHN